MILRKVTQLQIGNTIKIKHPRYSAEEFEVIDKRYIVDEFGGCFIAIKTKDIRKNFGPTIKFLTEDMVTVTPE